MLDATPEEIQRRLVHQKSNELSLLRHELSKVWKKKLGKHIVEKQGQDILTFEASGEAQRRNRSFRGYPGIHFLHGE